jgi:hypothetical protein
MALKLKPPTTATGTELFVIEPLPSWPSSFRPQQNAAPELVRVQVWSKPAARDAEATPPFGT